MFECEFECDCRIETQRTLSKAGRDVWKKILNKDADVVLALLTFMTEGEEAQRIPVACRGQYCAGAGPRVPDWGCTFFVCFCQIFLWPQRGLKYPGHILDLHCVVRVSRVLV